MRSSHAFLETTAPKKFIFSPLWPPIKVKSGLQGFSVTQKTHCPQKLPLLSEVKSNEAKAYVMVTFKIWAAADAHQRLIKTRELTPDALTAGVEPRRPGLLQKWGKMLFTLFGHCTNWGFRPQNRSHENSLDICYHRGTNVLLMSILRSRLRSL